MQRPTKRKKCNKSEEWAAQLSGVIPVPGIVQLILEYTEGHLFFDFHQNKYRYGYFDDMSGINVSEWITPLDCDLAGYLHHWLIQKMWIVAVKCNFTETIVDLMDVSDPDRIRVKRRVFVLASHLPACAFDTTAGCLYLIGGHKTIDPSWWNPSCDVVRVDVFRRTADVVFTLQTPRFDGKAMVRDHCLFVLGGVCQTNVRSDHVDIIDLKTMKTVANHTQRQRLEVLQQEEDCMSLFTSDQSLWVMTRSGTLYHMPWNRPESPWQVVRLFNNVVRLLCVGNTLLWRQYDGNDPPGLELIQLK